MIACVSKEESEDNFISNGITTVYSDINNGKITCVSTHLSIFSVIYTPYI